MKTYTAYTQIRSAEDARAFFHYIVNELKVNFHPDETFEEYIDLNTDEPSFSAEECAVYNRLMEEAFAACEKEGMDIYEIGMECLYPEKN